MGSKVGWTVTPEGCWNWNGHVRPTGYGVAKDPELRTQVGAHRAVWKQLVGPIPPGMQLDHLCRNRRCVNPDHLEIVTSRENTLRGQTIPAANAVKVECDNGHPFTPQNTYRHGEGRFRGCRLCRNEASNRYKARRRAAA